MSDVFMASVLLVLSCGCNFLLVKISVKRCVSDSASLCFLFFLSGLFDCVETRRQRDSGDDAEGNSGFTTSSVCWGILIQTLTLFLCSSQLHKQADMQEEKNRIERVLGAISAPDLIQKVLSFSLSVRVTSLLLPHLNIWRCRSR